MPHCLPPLPTSPPGAPDRLSRLALLALLALIVLACPEKKEPILDGGGPPVEAVDLLGQPLERPSLDAGFAAEQERLLEAARAQADFESTIWQGRRLGYLGRYREAIDLYTRALESGSEGSGSEALDAVDRARLLRHRGHRYLTVRRLGLAIADFEAAARLIEGRPDRVEADGLPNARSEPRSTLGTNVFYHLGLARYLRGEWPRAIDAFERGLELSKNDDMRVAMTYWLVLAHARGGEAAEDGPAAEPVRALLGTVSTEMDVIENQAYQRLLLAFRGDLELRELLGEARERGSQALATTAYGVGAWAFLSGDPAEAEAVWREILERGAWPAFGYLAAEAELARLSI